MANLLSAMPVVEQDLNVISSVAMHPLGTRAVDTAGNQYLYCQGVASGAANFFCTVATDGTTTLLITTTCYGIVGVMVGALVASTYGWVQIYGKATAVTAGDVAANAVVNTTATPGTVDDASTTKVPGALFAASRTGAGTVAVQLSYPTVNMS